MLAASLQPKERILQLSFLGVSGELSSVTARILAMYDS